MQNRPPADRLADIRSEIKRLEAEKEKLRTYLLEHPKDRIGIATDRSAPADTQFLNRIPSLLRFLVALAPVRGVVIPRQTFARRHPSRTNDH